MPSAAVLIVPTIAGLTTNSTCARVSHLDAAASDSVIATGPGYYAALHECGCRGATDRVAAGRPPGIDEEENRSYRPTWMLCREQRACHDAAVGNLEFGNLQ